MKKLLFLCLILISLNTKAIDSNKLINLNDLNILFEFQKNDWNENVLFLIKKNSFAKVDNDSDTFYLKSIFKDGEIITMPIFSNNIVKKIKFEYINFDLWRIKNILSNLYSLRIHRPVFSNIFFFGCIYFLIREIQEKKINERNILILSFLMGLLFSSFYYFFIIIFFSLFFVLLQKINFKIYNIKNYFPLILKSSLTFILTSLPFILNLYFHENDVSKGAGLISLNIEKKILILKYFTFSFAKIEFLLVFFTISLITFLFRKNINHKIILLFYIIFVSSVFSPIIFITILIIFYCALFYILSF